MDPLVVSRVHFRLVETAQQTPTGAGYWEALAEAATTEALRAVELVRLDAPRAPFLVLLGSRDGPEARRAFIGQTITRPEAMRLARERCLLHGGDEVCWVAHVLEGLAVVDAPLDPLGPPLDPPGPP